MKPRDPRLDGLPAQGELLAGKFRVERTINIGRVAVVVEGTDVQLGQRVAIKILAGEAAQSGRRLARFNREASAGTNIQSEHVVRVFELGTFSNGVFMVMEFLEGEDLSQVLKRGPLRTSTAVDYLLQVSEALAEAHQLGIVHRDLKPANLFLTRRADGSPWIKLLDFGVAKFGDGLTTTASFLGSPLYMAPEQLASTKNADGRADIWALGTLLFEMLTGTTPFPLQSLTEVCTSILYGEPRRLRDLVPHAPVQLEAVIMCCLRKNRDERFPTVAALAAAVAPFGGNGAAARMAKIVHTASRMPPPHFTDSRTDTDDDLPTMRYMASDFQTPRPPPETSSGFDPGPVAVTSDEPPRRRSALAWVFGTLGGLACLGIGGLGGYMAFAPARDSASAAPPPPMLSSAEADKQDEPPPVASSAPTAEPWPPFAAPPSASAAPMRRAEVPRAAPLPRVAPVPAPPVAPVTSAPRSADDPLPHDL